MSRFIDRLNRIARGTLPPMGFGAARPASSGLRMLLVASLAQTAETDRLADCVEGADAVLFNLAKSGLAAKELQKMTGNLPDIPWGARVADINAKKTGALAEAGCDFVVLTADSRVAAVPQDDKVGKILQVELSLVDGLLRTVNNLPVDAVLAGDVNAAGGSISLHHLMQIQRLVNLINKPLLVSAPLNPEAGELKVLWEAGVDGIVVEAGGAQPGGLKEVRQLISELPARSFKKRGTAEAMLPRVGRETGEIAEEEEAEEEDE